MYVRLGDVVVCDCLRYGAPVDALLRKGVVDESCVVCGGAGECVVRGGRIFAGNANGLTALGAHVGLPFAADADGRITFGGVGVLIFEHNGRYTGVNRRVLVVTDEMDNANEEGVR